MERKLFRKKDVIILAVLCLAAIGVFLFASRDKGAVAEIWVDGKIFTSFSLDEPFELTLDNGVTLKGDGKEAWFSHSDCPDKVCINTGKLSVSGEWAACLPNETVLKIVKGDRKVDTVS